MSTAAKHSPLPWCVERGDHGYWFVASSAPASLVFGGTDVLHAKAEARNAYLRHADALEPDWLVVIDADEFYENGDQARIAQIMEQFATEPRPPLLLKQRYPFYPPVYRGQGKPMFRHEVTGSYFSVPHLRIWPWYPGLRHRGNHNWPEFEDGRSLRDLMVRLDKNPNAPQCVHMAFASYADIRSAKHRYYEARGEAVDPARRKYVECRSWWETYRPTGRPAPKGVKILPWSGPIPEALR